ncbi:MAG: hypothetical protein ACTSRK_20650 [Promethearchaeota archaeon]
MKTYDLDGMVTVTNLVTGHSQIPRAALDGETIAYEMAHADNVIMRDPQVDPRVKSPSTSIKGRIFDSLIKLIFQPGPDIQIGTLKASILNKVKHSGTEYNILEKFRYGGQMLGYGHQSPLSINLINALSMALGDIDQISGASEFIQQLKDLYAENPEMAESVVAFLGTAEEAWGGIKVIKDTREIASDQKFFADEIVNLAMLCRKDVLIAIAQGKILLSGIPQLTQKSMQVFGENQMGLALTLESFNSFSDSITKKNNLFKPSSSVHSRYEAKVAANEWALPELIQMTDKLFHMWPHRRDANGIIVENSPAVQEFLKGINIDSLVSSTSYPNKEKLVKDIEDAIIDWWRNTMPSIHSNARIITTVTYHFSVLIGYEGKSTTAEWKKSLRYAVDQVLQHSDHSLTIDDYTHITSIWGIYKPSNAEWCSSISSNFQPLALINKIVSLSDSGALGQGRLNNHYQSPDISNVDILYKKMLKSFSEISETYSHKYPSNNINFIDYAQMLTLRQERIAALRSLAPYVDDYSYDYREDFNFDFVNRYLPTWLMNRHNRLTNRDELYEWRTWKTEDPSIHYGFQDLWGQHLTIAKADRKGWFLVRFSNAYLESIGVEYPIETMVQAQLDASIISPIVGKVMNWLDLLQRTMEERVGYTANGLELIRLGEKDLNYIEKYLKKSSAHSLGYDLMMKGILTGTFAGTLAFLDRIDSVLDITDEQIQERDQKIQDYHNRPKSYSPDGSYKTTIIGLKAIAQMALLGMGTM